MLELAFLSVCMDSCACTSISQFVWTVVLALAFLSVCMDPVLCTCVSQYLYGRVLMLAFAPLTLKLRCTNNKIETKIKGIRS